MLIFPRLAAQVHGMWPPLGIITLGTILKGEGHNVTCHDTSFDPDLGRVVGIIRNEKPDMVGVSCLTDFFPSAKEIVEEAKKAGAVTVIGGPHPTIMPEDCLCRIPELDYAVMGEAESVLPELVKRIENGETGEGIKGLAMRIGEEVVNNGPAEPLDLSTLPIPDRDLLDVNPEYLRSRAINMHASRGCPFKCKFCQPTLQRLFGRKVRFDPAEKVAEEIGHYSGLYGIKEFFFHDDTFTVSVRWMRELVEALRERGLIEGYRYVVNSRVDTFDREKAALLKEMGVYYVLFGIESGSQKILDSIGKGTTVDQAREAFQICREFGFRTHAYVLLGSPEESKQTLVETEELVDELKPNTVHISIYTPLLGTELADQCEAEGRITVKNYADLDYYLKDTSTGDPPIKIPGITYNDLKNSRERMLARRKWTVFRDNVKQLVIDLAREPSIDKLVFRYRFYRRMRHYFG